MGAAGIALAVGCLTSPRPIPAARSHGGAASPSARPGVVEVGEPPAGTFWARTRVVPLGESGMARSIVAAGALCSIQAREIRLTCTELHNGQPRFRYSEPPSEGPRWSNALASFESGRIYLTYAKGADLLSIALHPQTGAVLHRSELPYTSDPGRFSMCGFAPSGDRALVAYKPSFAKSGEMGHIALVDLGRRQVLRASDVPGLISFQAQGSGVAIFHGSLNPGWRPVLYAFDLATGARLWQFEGEPRLFFHLPTLTADSVLFSDDKHRMYRLDLKTGRLILKTEAKSSELSAGRFTPIPDGRDLIASTDRLYRLDAQLKPLAQGPKLEWIRGVAVSGSAVAAHSNRKLYILDKHSLQLLAQFDNNEEWHFDAVHPGAPGTFSVVSRFRYNDESEERFELYRPVGSGTLDLGDLPAGVVAYESGHLLGTGSIPLAHGAHELDLLRPGFYPVALPVQIRAGDASKPRPAEVTWTPAPESPPAFTGALPHGLEITTLAKAVTRTVTRPRELRGPSIFRAGLELGLEYNKRLWLFDAYGGRLLWSIPHDALVQAISPSLPSKLKASRFAKLLPAAIVPEANVVLIVTEGLVENYFAAFDAKTGAPRWSVPARLTLPHMASHTGGYFTERYWVHRGLFWHRGHELLFARDWRTGKLVLEHYYGDGAHGELVFRGNTLYYLFHNQLRAADLFSLKQLWATEVGDAELYPAPDGENLFVVTDTQVKKVSPAGQIVASSPELQGNVNDNPTLFDKDGAYVCGHYACTVYGLSQNLGVRWSYREPSGASPCARLVSDHQVMAADGGKMLIFDKKQGTMLKPSGDSFKGGHPWQVGQELCFAGYEETTCYRIP